MTPSKYWQFMADRHVCALGVSGIENFKRTVALDYFDWRYPLHRPHMVFWSHLWDLWKRTTVREKIRAIHPRFYHFVVRLTWQYACRMDEYGVTGLCEPLQGNPVPVYFGGRLVSQDLANTALEVRFMQYHSPIPKRVIEVGAGYGRMASVLLMDSGVEYVIVDVEPALSVARWYLSQLYPQTMGRVRFLSPEQLKGVEDGWATHAISISTFAEFTKEQVKYYLDHFDRCAQWIYLKGYERFYNPRDETVNWFSELYRANWDTVAMEQCPIQSTMLQAVYRNNQ